MVLFCFVQELAESSDVHGSCSLLLPFATGKARRDLLEQPAVSVWILKRGKREVGPTLRVAPRRARVLHDIVERAAGVVEDFADVDTAGDQVLAGSVDVIHGEDEVSRARLGRRDSLAKDDRCL